MWDEGTTREIDLPHKKYSMWNKGSTSELLVPREASQPAHPESPSPEAPKRSSFFQDAANHDKYVQLASMARGALLQMTNPKLRVFRHAVPLAALILVVNISVTVGVVYYYIYHACQTQSAVMLNFVGEEGLTILKENPGVEIISSYAMGISATEYSYLTSSSSNVTWASIFTPCPDGDNTCGSSQILGDAVMELRQENKDLREELQKQTKELKDDLHKQNKEMRAEIVKLLATLGKTEISVSQRKNML